MRIKTRWMALKTVFCVVSLAMVLTMSGSYVYADREGGEPRHAIDPAIEKTKEKGFEGVDFSYDLFGGPPGQSASRLAQQTMAKDQEEKPKVMAKQAKLLHDRYRLDCKTHSAVRMTKGKLQPIGPTVQLKEGLTWDKLAQMDAEEIRKQKAFPAGFMRLPHVKHDVGGMVFPDEQIRQFPRLERFDVDFDLPACFLPEFPPPIFLGTASPMPGGTTPRGRGHRGG